MVLQLQERDADRTGIAVPVGIGPSAGDNEVFLYFSVEHPLARRRLQVKER
jgi:hypothetical protein